MSIQPITNKYTVSLVDGSKIELQAGGLRVGPVGELIISDVTWSLMHTIVRDTGALAPGTWSEWKQVV